MRRGLAATAVLCAALTLTGCTSDDADANTSQTSTLEPPAPTSSASDDKDEENEDDGRNERGLLEKKLGEKAQILWAGKEAVAFTLHSVEIDPPCTAWGERPESGHTLLLDISVATSDVDEANSIAALTLMAPSFAELGKDGVTHPAGAGFCTGIDGELPPMFGKNQKYRGTIEIVVPEASGTLILTYLGDGGWEWTYPTK
jgi:hypothetical protein